MRNTPLAAALAACLLCAAATAQQATPAPAASGAPAARVGPDYTPGWEMMTPTERNAYRERMYAAPTPAECRRMRDEQLKMAAERARTRGIKDLPNPRFDACSEN